MSYNDHDDDPTTVKGGRYGTTDLRNYPFASDVKVTDKDGNTHTEKLETFEDIQSRMLSHYGRRGQEARKRALQGVKS